MHIQRVDDLSCFVPRSIVVLVQDPDGSELVHQRHESMVMVSGKYNFLNCHARYALPFVLGREGLQVDKLSRRRNVETNKAKT